MSALPCPHCGKPVDDFHARTEDPPGGPERVLVFVHADMTRCQIRVGLAASHVARRVP